MFNDDFVISVHALDRFQERFPELWTNDEDVALLIHREVTDAVSGGRQSVYVPSELITERAVSGSMYAGCCVWEPSKTRGYILEDCIDGQVVVTVLRSARSAATPLARLPKTRSVPPRPVWARHLRRTKLNTETLPPPTDEEKADAVLVLEDPTNEVYYGLWDEAHRIFIEASE